ncbi:DUF58 domain-containing protein [Spirilliplanes yamanashiensis]|uniref:DUF58 domain-containing protein n=1 Tax=Spirilliplanes yamanashiensis TaxID=42233 RepID=A0A8J4DHS6_9ACTN|nr:DUF58 domain-containing protein [Spirilliplanes yamanashiensis]MDP9819785.1 uncharacterized protein (DUF58 family) [Spirilliplanes yamanashiensis]GIJ01395.1 hypothetical protein Sya03_07470 [Spirilliplanes yamanashiensis]
MSGGATVTELLPQRRLRRLELQITRRLDGLLHGQHLGLLPGVGSEPAGSREYRAGEDEVRRMDWAVTARTAVPHVRQLDADRELATWVLVDATPSMDFGTGELEKRELAVAGVAAVGFLTAGAGNRLGAYLLGGDGITRFPARTGRTHLLGLLRALLAVPRGIPAAQPVPLAAAVDNLHRATPRRGLVVVVSDFLDGLPDDGLGPGAPDWEKPLRRLAARHQVLAVHVTDPRERELPDVGLITLVDPETGARREVGTASRRLRERYAAAAAEQQRAVAAALRRTGAAHLTLSTDRDWVADIVRHVHTQRRLAAGARHRPIGGGTP